jgi:hypothetical protein
MNAEAAAAQLRVAAIGQRRPDRAHLPLVGHKRTSIIELICRKQIRPILDTGATAMDDIFGNGSHADSHSADLDDDQEEGHNDDDLDYQGGPKRT